MDKFTSILDKFESHLWAFQLEVPAEISSKYIQGTNRRIIIAINDSDSIKCALMPDGKGAWFILMNKQIRDKLGLNLGESVQVEIEKDSSEYGLDMPDEFRELLNQEEEAKVYFDNLTPGKKRNLIYIISKVKNTDSRLRKALAIVQHLKEFRGELDFKILNQTIKYYNNL